MSPRAARVQPWEKQAAESGPAYEAFKRYRDFGLSRSLVKTAEAVGKNESLIDRWSSKHSWPMRALQFDRWQEREYLDALRRARVTAAKRNVDLAAVMKNVAASTIADLATNQTKLKVAEVTRLLEVAARLEAVAFHSDMTVQVTMQDPAGKSTPDRSRDLTDEERRARMAQLLREAKSRMDGDDDEDEAS